MSRVPKDLMQEPTLCKARRKNGEPCRNPPMLGSTVCRMHGGAAPQVKRRAQQRILEASDQAAYRLVQMMQDTKIPPAVQLAAARDLLDRAGLGAKQEVSIELEVPSWEASLQELFVVYPDGPASPGKKEVVEDAVIVPDEQDAIEAANDALSEQLERQRMRRKRQGYSGAPVTPPTVRAKAVIRNQPPRQSRDVSGPDISGPNEP